MHIVIWSYRVAPGREAEFEAMYGAEGDWVQLFRRRPEYLGTELLRDVADPARYLTIDRWADRASYDAFRHESADEYAAIDARGDALTVEEAALGVIA